MPAVSDERRLRVVDALTGDEPPMPPQYVALLHGAGCTCEGFAGQGLAVGGFVNPHPLALLGWAQTQCPVAVIARMIPPSPAARTLAGAR